MGITRTCVRLSGRVARVNSSEFSDRPDGVLHYRRDVGGEEIGIIPATCKVCGRTLHKVGFRASHQDGVMLVDCIGCAKTALPGHAWQLTALDVPPIRVELDDEPYIPITSERRPKAGPFGRGRPLEFCRRG